MNDSNNSLTELVKGIIAEQVGLEIGDIHEEDSLVEDLHMTPSDLSELLENLNNKGIETDELDITETASVGQLIELLESRELLE